jgi:transcriptional regulator with XRE-family HTH domain
MTRKLLVNASEIDRQVGERMRRRRILLGLTQDDLSEALGISYQQIQKYETGANRISAGRLAQIASVLDSQVGWFFGAVERDNAQDDGEAARAAVDLVRQYARIRDERVRAQITSLVRTLADTDEGASVVATLENAPAARSN